MIGLGYRREMADWDLSLSEADFFEIAPENWIRRDRSRLHSILSLGKDIRLHGVSLNLGGTAALSKDFLLQVRLLKEELGSHFYSDHLAASGDAHQLYDLFPIPFTAEEVRRVSERIRYAQDVLGCRLAIENTTYYTNIGEMTESQFLSEVVREADCHILLDINNICVNYKNHRCETIDQYLKNIDFSKVSYIHVAGHTFNEQFGMYIDTHSAGVEVETQITARFIAQHYQKDILLEWDNEVPSQQRLNEELQCLMQVPSTIMCAA